MKTADHDPMKESRSRLQEAMLLMDEGKFRESAEVCFEGSMMAMEAMLASWDLKPNGSNCWEMLKEIGLLASVDVPSSMRHFCRRIDQYHAFYHSMEGLTAQGVFDEEYSMELINYGREILKFAHRNLCKEADGKR
jgi:hypothetical protein